jgi:hypothetical protein
LKIRLLQEVQVTILTFPGNDWCSLYESIEQCEHKLVQNDSSVHCFQAGEQHAYAEGLQTLRTEILPFLQRRLGGGIQSFTLEYSGLRPGQGMSLTLTIADSNFEIFSVFFDTFASPRQCIGNVWGFVDEVLKRSRRSVNSLL